MVACAETTDLPVPLRHDYRTPRAERLATYPLDEPFVLPSRKRRKVKPRQLVVASLVGDMVAGHTYFVVVPQHVYGDEAAFAGIAVALARLGGRFSPPVDFYLFAEGTPIADVTGMNVRGAPLPCSEEARRPEVVAHSPIVQSQRLRAQADHEDAEVY